MQRRLCLFAVVFIVAILMAPAAVQCAQKPITDSEIVARVGLGIEAGQAVPFSLASRNPALHGARNRNLKSCIPYGYLCDPRYVTDPVCCPGTNCFSPYPGVPKYCL